MKKYYEIPQNCTYEQFAKMYIKLKLYNAKYIQQLSICNKNILYVGDDEFTPSERNINIIAFQVSEFTPTPKHSVICTSIRIKELEKSEKPYECIANKINSFPYILSDAVLHTDQYGIQRLIFL